MAHPPVNSQARKKKKHELKQPMKDLKGLPKGEAQKPFTKKSKEKSKASADY